MSKDELKPLIGLYLIHLGIFRFKIFFQAKLYDTKCKIVYVYLAVYNSHNNFLILKSYLTIFLLYVRFVSKFTIVNYTVMRIHKILFKFLIYFYFMKLTGAIPVNAQPNSLVPDIMVPLGHTNISRICAPFL